MIPEAAVVAAARVLYAKTRALNESDIRAALAAAAPHMLAEAWDEGEKVGFEESFRDNDPRPTQNPYRSAK